MLFRHRFTLAVVGLFVFFAISGCTDKRVPLIRSQEVFAGRWTAADGTFVHIYLDGGGDVKTSREEIKGGRAAFQEKLLTIDRGWQKQSYQINQLPRREGDKWIMVLNGIAYVRALSTKEDPIATTLPPPTFQSENTFAGNVERFLQKSFLDRTEIMAHSVTCPIGIESTSNSTFNCRIVSSDGSTLEVNVSPQEGQDIVAWSPKQGLISLSTLEKGIQENLQKQIGQGTRVSCGGKPYKIAHQSEKFLCEATFTDGKKKQIEIAVIDRKGNVRWQIY